MERGYELEYDNKTQHIYDGNDILSEQDCMYVSRVMGLYDVLQHAYEHLQDKTGINEQILVFPGFDGNTESIYLGYANFLRTRSSAFVYLRVRGNDLNSHMPTGMDMYNRMLDAWYSLDEKQDLSREEILLVLDARIHPDNRKSV